MKYKIISEQGFLFACALRDKKTIQEQFESLEDCLCLDNTIILEHQKERIHDLKAERNNILKERNELVEALEELETKNHRIQVMNAIEKNKLSKALSEIHRLSQSRNGTDSILRKIKELSALPSAEGKEEG